MGCQGSRLSLDEQKRPGYITFDEKTIQYIRTNETEIKSKLRERCEKNFAKRNLHHSNSIKNILRRSRHSEVNVLRLNKSNQSLKDSNQLIGSVVDQVVKYAVNDYKVNTRVNADQVIQSIIMQGNSSVASTHENNLTDSNNNSMSATDNSLFKKILNIVVDDLDFYLKENSLAIFEFEIEKVTDTVIEPVMKLKDALELARQMFYEGKYSIIFSNKTGGYIVREAKDGQLKTDKENGIERLTSFVSEAKQLKAKYLQTPVTILNQ